MGIAYAIQGITIRANKATVLAKLRGNRAEHKKIVVEARAGYVDKAKVALEAKLEKVRRGKIVSLQFALHPPTDMTGAYDAVISAFELHEGASVDLTAQQVRCFIDDDWDWMATFLESSSAYSGTARAKLNAVATDEED